MDEHTFLEGAPASHGFFALLSPSTERANHFVESFIRPEEKNEKDWDEIEGFPV